MNMRKRGFSIPEVVLAFGLLAVATLSIVAVFIAGLRQHTQAEKVTAATQIAGSMLEAVRSDGFSSIPSSAAVYDGRKSDPNDPVTGFPPPPYPSTTVGGTTYFVVVETKPHGSDRISIEVQVYWEDGSRVRLESSFVPS